MVDEPRRDNVVLRRLLARRRAERAERLARARRDAAERGKEPFDFDAFVAVYPGQPGDRGRDRAARAREWEERYYTTFTELMTMAEFAATQAALDAGAEPPRPSG